VASTLRPFFYWDLNTNYGPSCSFETQPESAFSIRRTVSFVIPTISPLTSKFKSYLDHNTVNTSSFKTLLTPFKMTSNDSNSHSTSTLEGAAKIATDGNASAANGNSSQTKIAPGSRILVTGGGGYLASAIVDQLLTQGFKVRATTRTRSKLDELKKKADKTFGAGKLEVLEIKDLSVKGALDAALKGEL